MTKDTTPTVNNLLEQGLNLIPPNPKPFTLTVGPLGITKNRLKVWVDENLCVKTV